MGNAQMVAASAHSSDHNTLPATLGSAVTFQERLGGGQFLKSVKCMNEDGALVVKIYSKRHAVSLSSYEEMLAEVRQLLTLNGSPNVMPFRWFKETPQAAYLVRQYFHQNLLERMGTPPFLMPVEKRWLAFQLLQAVQQCHAVGVCHGDIKCENVMVTSWGWVFLCDLANFKPQSLPQDDPTNFNYFFCSARKGCAVAPERFTETATADGAPGARDVGLQPASDVFSCGCVLLELFNEAGPPFELPQLLRYTRGEPMLDAALSSVRPAELGRLLGSMTHRDPKARPTAEKCLRHARGGVLDECFYSFAFGFFMRLRLMDQPSQADELCECFEMLVRELRPCPPAATPAAAAADDTAALTARAAKAVGSTTGYLRRAEEEMRVSAEQAAASGSDAKGGARGAASTVAAAAAVAALAADRVSKEENASTARARHAVRTESALVLVVTSMCAAVRNVPSTHLKLSLMRRLVEVSFECEDALCTQRVLPYLVSMLSDAAPLVRAEAVRLTASLLEAVDTLQPMYVPPRYLLHMAPSATSLSCPSCMLQPACAAHPRLHPTRSHLVSAGIRA